MKKMIQKLLGLSGRIILKTSPDRRFVKIYLDYKDFTMIPESLYYGNLKIVDSLVPNIKGDVVECGVWRGGMIAGISTLLGNNRNYYLFDSFEGLPTATETDGEAALQWQKNTTGYNYHDNCKAEIEFAEKAMSKTNNNYSLRKGWFSETLPVFKPEKPIALLRLDGDWYESTIDCLKNLYQYVNYGGIIIIDDYYTWDGCSRAVHDFLSSIKSVSRMSQSPEGICYIIKQDKCCVSKSHQNNI